MSRYNPTPGERHPKESPTACLAEKSTNRTTHQINANYPGSNTRPRKRALTLTFLVKPQGEPYPTDSGSVPLRFQGRVKPCASNHTLETKQRPPPAETYGASTPATLALRQTLAPSDPIKKTERSTIQALRSAIKYLAINVHHPFFRRPRLNSSTLRPRSLGSRLSNRLGSSGLCRSLLCRSLLNLLGPLCRNICLSAHRLLSHRSSRLLGSTATAATRTGFRLGSRTGLISLIEIDKIR